MNKYIEVGRTGKYVLDDSLYYSMHRNLQIECQEQSISNEWVFKDLVDPKEKIRRIKEYVNTTGENGNATSISIK